MTILGERGVLSWNIRPHTGADGRVPGAYQGHISYTVRPAMWAAFDATYYVGGESSIDGVSKHDRQSNARIGATLALPVKKRHSVKLAWSTGAVVRSGADFTAFSIGWQTVWF